MVSLLAHQPSELLQRHPDLSHLAMTIRPLRVVVARGGRAWMGPGNEALVEHFYKEDLKILVSFRSSRLAF